MTVEQAAEQLGMAPKTVRIMMRRKQLPIGIVKKDGVRCAFYIFPKWLDRYLAGDPVEIPEGMTLEEKI